MFYFEFFNENVSFDNPKDALKYAEDKLRTTNAEIDALFTSNPFNAAKNAEKIPGKGYCSNTQKYKSLMIIKSNYEKSIKEIKRKMKNINEKVIDLKLSIYESCIKGSITKNERDNLLFTLNEKVGVFAKFKNKDKDKLTLDNIEDKMKDLEKDEKNIKSIMKKMQTECILYLKKYINTSEFKKNHKDNLYMINIEAKNYGDTYSIQICKQQDGLDNDNIEKWLSKNKGKTTEDCKKENPAWFKKDWYNELLSKGTKYLKNTFKAEIKEFGLKIHTGDGDECNIYISER